ncbi:LysM peptidoglycan-binding domain-containing protein [Nocardioides sp.]|uniref:LysM peptidoglycan-binding domain-containing protein n=1 Tax=Nocardioides sp. TaxID=35761 RepID=UPI002ED6014D
MSTMTLSAPIARPTSTVRLTRRGRLVVFAAGLLAILALGVFWGTGSVASGERGQAERTLVVQVQPGDTLYDLAARLTTDGDVNAMVEQIEDLNRLDSSFLYAGQKLRVPTGG